MILTGLEIISQLEKSRISISPFNLEHISTNSYDLCLGDKLLIYESEILDPTKENKYNYITIPENGYLLDAGCFVLGHTIEVFGSEHYVPIIHGKSSTARTGLFVHVTADLIDIGWLGSSTLQLYATLPVYLHRGMRIAQVSFWVPNGKITLYNGKYQGATLPMPSFAWKDFFKNKAL